MIKRVDENGNVRLITNIRKPRKWRRYEYLESSGTQYIDTGIKLSLTDKFEFETEFTYSPANGRACPFYGTENYQTGFMAQYHYTNNNLYVLYIKGSRFGGDNISITASSRMYSKTVIDIPNKTLTTIYNTTSSNGTYSNQITDTTSTVKFFGNDQYSKYIAKCYYFKIKINDVLVRDFVPAQYNGQYGMWDLVENKFYGNSGTGTFTVGPEIKNYDEINEVRKSDSILPDGSGTYPVSYLYDRTIYEEPDGSKWLRIAHHDDPSTRRFTSSDSFTTYIHTSNDLFFDVSWCNNFTQWELMVKQKTTSEATEQKFRWIQNYNPMTATFDDTKRVNVTYDTSSGYTVPSENWGGLMKINSTNTYLCGNNGGNGQWWGAIGCKVLFSGGLPGWNNQTVTTGYLDLYIRIA